MKSYSLRFIALTAWLATVVSLCAQADTPEASLTVKVVDDDGKPIAGALVGIDNDVFKKPPSGNGVANAEGFHSARLRTMGSLFFGARMEGFYSAGGEFFFNKGAMKGDPGTWATRRWEPWNPTVEIVLKKKGQPIAMYAKWIEIEPPEKGKPTSFDLEAGDWVAPHGKGKVADLIFDGRGAIENSTYQLTWKFSNLGDGIQVLPRAPGGVRSELKSPKEAPADGYAPSITIDASQRVVGADGPTGEKPACFLFRVRTVLDEKGKVISANYGKIYPSSDFRVAYYLNPTVNSRTLEYDPRRNLFLREFGGLVVNDP